MPVIDGQERIEALLTNAEKKIATRIRTALAAVINTIDLDELAELLRIGDWDGAAGYAEGVGRRIAASVRNDGYLAAALAMAEDISTAAVLVDFDPVNQRAVDRMASSQLRLIRGFTAEQRALVRRMTGEAIEDGLNPREMARRFRDSVGLTEYQQGIVRNYERQLRAGSLSALDRKLRDARFDRTVRRAVIDDKPLSDAQINNMVSRYKSRWRNYRSEVIARTEALRAVHQGGEDMIAQAVEEGSIDPNTIERKWVTAKDERVRGSHRFMNQQKQPLQTAFLSGNGNLLSYPGDPGAPANDTIQCRCVLTTRIITPTDNG